jgi:hypothetical protein
MKRLLKMSRKRLYGTGVNKVRKIKTLILTCAKHGAQGNRPPPPHVRSSGGLAPLVQNFMPICGADLPIYFQIAYS